MILPGETEAGTAGTQPCRGISRWAHRDDERGRESSFLRRQTPSDRKTPCLENPRPKGGIFLSFGENLPLIFTLNQDTVGRASGIFNSARVGERGRIR